MAALVLTMGLLVLVRGDEPAADAASAPFQAYLLPLEIQKIQDTALAELLKLRPELKAEDLKVNQLMYMLMPDPDHAVQQNKDGTEKKLWLSSNYQQLSVGFQILSTKHPGTADNRDVVICDTATVNFPNARSKQFSVSKGTSTRFH